MLQAVVPMTATSGLILRRALWVVFTNKTLYTPCFSNWDMIMTMPVTPDVLTIPRKDMVTGSNLIGMTRAQLSDALRAIDIPEKQIKMRTGQIWAWIYNKGLTSFEDMTNLSKDI